MNGEAAKVLGPAPRLVLALALHDQGKNSKARQTLASATLGFDWCAADADRRDIWIVHLLRREAEAKILVNLPAFLNGEYQPTENEERLALLGICQFQGRYRTAARLFADAFASDPALIDQLSSTCHSFAARRNKSAIDRLDELAAESRSRAPREDICDASNPVDRRLRVAGRHEDLHRSVSRRWSPTRSAFAMIVSAGFTAPDETKKLPSTT
jgi:hypothetical protein